MKLKDVALITGAAAVIAAVALNTDIKTPAEYYALHPTEVTDDGAYVTLKIDSSRVSNGSVILEGKYALASGDSVFDVASRVLNFEGVPFDYKGGRNIYVQSIAGLDEFEFGAQSGWVYTVNGEMPGVSCAQYEPCSGDEIVFLYVDELYDGGDMK